jgi:heavy metal translocating P-type ATPase
MNKIAAHEVPLDTPNTVNTLQASCQHCGTLLANTLESFERAGFCCRGCELVHAFLQEEHLTEFYAIRKRTGALRSAPVRDGSLESGRSLNLTAEQSAQISTNAGGVSCFLVPGLTCAACLWAVEKAVLRIEGVSACTANLFAKTVEVNIESNADKALPRVFEILTRLGLAPSRPLKEHSNPAPRIEGVRAQIRDVGIAGVLFGNAMIFAAANYFGEIEGISSAFHNLFVLLAGILATFALAFPGRIFFRHAFLSLRMRSLHIDLPIAFALFVAFLVSIYNVYLTNVSKVYFDSITGLVFLLLSARLLNDTLVQRARKLALLSRTLLPEGAAHLRPGDEVDIAPGEMFPSDGTVLLGTTEVSEATLTGESRLVVKTVGDRVLGGTHNISHSLRLRVDVRASESYLAHMEKLLEKALDGKPKAVGQAERVLPWFVGVTFALAILVFLYWWPRDQAQALENAIAIFIVSCPCAIALGTPLVFAAGLKRAWKQGAIVKSAATLESLADVNVIVCDKTGTLTRGMPEVKETLELPSPKKQQEFLSNLHFSVQKSKHLVSGALARHCEKLGIDSRSQPIMKVQVKEIPGCGLKATFSDGSPDLFVGRPGWIKNMTGEKFDTETEKGTGFVAAVQGDLRALFVIEDSIRPEAAALIGAWRKRGVRVIMATGDGGLAALAVAKQLDFPVADVHFELLPEEKLALISKLKEQPGATVLMVGDGINDAACLGNAHVGVALKGSADVSISAGDVLLREDSLCGVEALLCYSKYLRTSLRIALATSATYNAIAVIFAAQGAIHPLIAALIMPLSSLSILLIINLRKGTKSWKSCSF